MVTILAVLGALVVMVCAAAAFVRFTDWVYGVRLRLRRYEAATSAAREARKSGKSYDEQARAAFGAL